MREFYIVLSKSAVFCRDCVFGVSGFLNQLQYTIC